MAKTQAALQFSERLHQQSEQIKPLRLALRKTAIRPFLSPAVRSEMFSAVRAEGTHEEDNPAGECDHSVREKAGERRRGFLIAGEKYLTCEKWRVK